MNNYSLLAREGLQLIKENSLYSALTIIASFIITNKIIIPLLSSRKSIKFNKFSALRIEKLVEYFAEKKSKNFIFSYLNIGLEKPKEIDDDLNNPSDKIKKTKKIIKKLTEDYLKNDQKTRNDKYDSRKDQIFYLLLNNMHVIKENNNNNNNN